MDASPAPLTLLGCLLLALLLLLSLFWRRAPHDAAPDAPEGDDTDHARIA